MAASPTTNNGGSIARPIKKICIILISLIPAVALLSITNVIIAHMFVATAVLFPPKPKAASPSVVQGNNRSVKPKSSVKKYPPKVETKTVYISPTAEDLERIKQELETADPLPPITTDDDSQRSAARVQTVITSTETLLNQRDQDYEMAKKEIGDLAESFASFVERLEQDTSRDVPTSAATAKHFGVQLTFLRSVLGRTSFKDLDRQDLMHVFTVVMEDLRWLLSAEEPSADGEKNALFYNVNNTLFTALIDETTSEVNVTNSACHPLYLALDDGKASIEFTPPPKTVTKKPKVKYIKPAATPMSNETARESHLYGLVENIKNILSRRDLSSLKLDEHESLPNPIDDDGVDDIRLQILPMVNTIQKKWETLVAQELQMREYWMGRIEAMKTDSIPSSDDGGGPCATPDLVEGMVAGGLETLRRKGVLRSTLVHGVFTSLSDNPDMVLSVSDEMKKVVVEEVFPEIEDENDGGRVLPPPTPGSSSWKLGKRSIFYAVDGPLLHHGIVGWIDSFVDAISGYNDHIDAMVDWAIGDEEVSVGTSMVDAFSKIVRKIPFPVEYVRRFKKAGILAGRTRTLLEE
eukprot:CAMPEP_0201919336 /NCGR_PEP_ID=MMETSP0903-20130614/8264_1 /ASSEMBLY_ACC=CAM_ASM_000552 /TAXON_ID=420261 /ORGANISM="Thalassiosira antarctica, Strain CCMP982" /LENGTH=578 /DNA_ID=CAMNT_0048455849 /DNA_START=22 /DNA_END=1758 /DNA_ORIENTATION=+